MNAVLAIQMTFDCLILMAIQINAFVILIILILMMLILAPVVIIPGFKLKLNNI